MLKVLLAAALVAFIGFKINQQPFWNALNEVKLTTTGLFYLLMAVLLMPLNWSLEAIKWRFSMQLVYPYTFLGALKAVLAGLSTGLITPNRLGNFIGRVQHLPPDLKTKGTLLTMFCNVAQFIITILAGVVALVFFSLIS